MELEINLDLKLYFEGTSLELEFQSFLTPAAEREELGTNIDGSGKSVCKIEKSKKNF